jgi:anthranilate synthase/aminodeoxychorismate synthase-like glutamine amidotransferase
MILVIDNYDSFTYNLVQYLGEMGAALCVVRNDQITLPDVRALNPTHIVISPGPGNPDDGGVSLDVVREMGSTTPVLGVCLGHQCIGQVYGGVVKRASRQMHGKTSLIYHDQDAMFDGMSNPFEATRYHSLIVEPETLPDCLRITARTAEGEIMGLRHRAFPVYGVQFHPESILTPEGPRLLRNFLEASVPEKVS